jgi:hypothetical protein
VTTLGESIPRDDQALAYWNPRGRRWMLEGGLTPAPEPTSKTKAELVAGLKSQLEELHQNGWINGDTYRRIAHLLAEL